MKLRVSYLFMKYVVQGHRDCSPFFKKMVHVELFSHKCEHEYFFIFFSHVFIARFYLYIQSSSK